MNRGAPVWPTPQQELLLKTALLSKIEATAAWTTWNSQVDLIEDHLDEGSFRLLPLVYKNLHRHEIDGQWMRRLKGIYRYAWAQNIQLFHATAVVLRLLHTAGLQTIVLKGAALSLLHYRDRGARPMSDFDILVPTEEAQTALDCLTEAGWRLTEEIAPGNLRYHYSTALVNSADQELDLHWHTLRECVYADADSDFWAEAVPVEILDVASKALHPADSLLHAIIHGIRWNPMPSIRWVADAAAIVRATDQDLLWDRLLKQARKRGLLFRLGEGLGYLNETIGIPVPDSVLRECERHSPSLIERVEYSKIQKPLEQVYDSAIGGHLLLFVEYCRLTRGQRFWPRLWGYPAFVQHCYGLTSRSQVLSELTGRVPRKLCRIFKHLTRQISKYALKG